MLSRFAQMLPPETAHGLAIRGLKLAEPWLTRDGASQAAGADDRDAGGVGQQGGAVDLGVSVAGLMLPNPVGLAAGFDKGCEVPDACAGLGFGFVECGAVTPQPQPGNPKPRVFRAPSAGALINRLGFNSDGLEAAAARLKVRRAVQERTGRAGAVMGVNLGANKDSADRAGDYLMCLKGLWGLADFFTINISSPNTVGLRELQERDALESLLNRCAEARMRLAGDRAATPLFVKVAPDMDDIAIEQLAETVRLSGAVDGLIVSNTTIARPEGLEPVFAAEAGGLSGRPLFESSTRVLKQFRRVLGSRLPLIGVGGVEDGRTAYAKIRAGASAVQLYTALVYRGPGIARQIMTELSDLLAADGFSSLSEAIGADVKGG